MRNERAAVEPILKHHGLPEEILAIPIVESGYQALPQSANPTAHGAGMWQFIPATACNYGLRVPGQCDGPNAGGQIDERLDTRLATDAAARYLKANRLRFQNWLLAILAYNMGENRVQKGIGATGSRSAWTLIRNGHEGDGAYLARVMAAILIAENPEIVE